MVFSIVSRLITLRFVKYHKVVAVKVVDTVDESLIIVVFALTDCLFECVRVKDNVSSCVSVIRGYVFGVTV